MIVKYSKKFPYAPYLNEDIGFEMQVDAWGNGIDEEKIIDGLNKLKAIAEKFHKENNPQLENGQTWKWESSYKFGEPIPYDGTGVNPTNPFTTTSQPLPSIDYKAKQTLEMMIDDSNTPDELVKLIMDDKTRKQIVDFGLEDHYNQKRNSFPNIYPTT